MDSTGLEYGPLFFIEINLLRSLEMKKFLTC